MSNLAPLAQLRAAAEETLGERLWADIYSADEMTLKQALAAALLGDTELARQIVQSAGAWRVMEFPNLLELPPLRTAVEMTERMTADEFIGLITDHVKVEAVFTEENNEERTLLDYLSDLDTRIQRIIAREIEP